MSTAVQLLALSEDQPVVVAGRPGALRTKLPFADPGTAPIVVRDATVRLDSANEAASPVVRASLVAVLQPGQVTSAVLRLGVDQQTPPGTYRGEIDVAGTTRRLELTILEDVRLAIDPSPVVLDRGAGSTLCKTVLFRNLGNVMLRIELPSPIAIGGELPLSAAARPKVVASSPAGQAISDLVDKVFEGREVYLVEKVGEMQLRLLQGGFQLAPGEARSAAVECVLPDRLAPEHRYHARAPVYDQDLVFVVVPASRNDTRALPREQERPSRRQPRPREKRAGQAQKG